jgi:hypothetical protein
VREGGGQRGTTALKRRGGGNCNLYLLLSAGRIGIVLQERNELNFYED